MFLKNWYRALATMVWAGSTFDNHTVTNLEGAEVYLNLNTRYNFLIGSNTTNNIGIPTIYALKNEYTGSGVVLGTGNAEPSTNDYCLSGALVTTYTYTASVTKTMTDDGYKLSAIYTITNAGSAAITIGEIGIFCSNGFMSDTAYPVLYERTALEAPVTIEPGGIGQVTYEIDLNAPSGMGWGASA